MLSRGGGTECSPVELTPRRACLLNRLVDVAERMHAERDVNFVIRIAAEAARDIFGARQAVTSVVTDPRHPRPVHAVAPAKDRPYGQSPSEADGPEFPTGPDGVSGHVRLSGAGLAAPI